MMSRTRRSRSRPRGAGPDEADGTTASQPTSLPCLTIARSPANDARVILDALTAMPALHLLRGEGDAWLDAHRAELRALLQHLTTRLSGMIEGARARGGSHPVLASHGVAVTGAPDDGTVVAPVARRTAPDAGSVRAPRPAARHRARNDDRHAPPAPPHPAAWDGGSFLR